MKRADLLKRLHRIADERDVDFVLERQGKHENWLMGGMLITIPRHREINDFTARAILEKARAG